MQHKVMQDITRDHCRDHMTNGDRCWLVLSSPVYSTNITAAVSGETSVNSALQTCKIKLSFF